MISKNKIKLIKSLSQKKYRVKENLFLAEGNKITRDFLMSDFRIHLIICTDDFYKSIQKYISGNVELLIASQEDIHKCSLQKSPQEALILCEIPKRNFNYDILNNDIILCLDGIQDPGNFGTIIRIADWFGIKTICASKNTADVFNPKVVQASMGSILNVKTYYTDLPGIIKKANLENIPTYGTFLNGKNIYTEQLPENGIIVMGNEGNGISKDLELIIKNRLHIPSIETVHGKSTNSLNVSIATAIICSEFRRVKLQGYSK
ncbi:MAG: RNA methyltransferase [Mariniphaga sp.]|nr:RNA methyltransferase [Mariniphaga sp.]